MCIWTVFQVLLGEVNAGLSTTQVVVKELKASASVHEQMQFLEEVQPYRYNPAHKSHNTHTHSLKHSNIRHNMTCFFLFGWISQDAPASSSLAVYGPVFRSHALSAGNGALPHGKSPCITAYARTLLDCIRYTRLWIKDAPPAGHSRMCTFVNWLNTV